MNFGYEVVERVVKWTNSFLAMNHPECAADDANM